MPLASKSNDAKDQIEALSEGAWHVQAVQFVKNRQRQECHFAFLMIGEVFALGDID